MQSSRDIQDRTFEFALRIVALSQSLPNVKGSWVIAKQVLRAGTSIGANVEEAHSASSRPDFIYRIEVALREARETHYWLRVIQASNLLKPDRLDEIISEAEQLKKILGAIASKSKRKAKIKP